MRYLVFNSKASAKSYSETIAQQLGADPGDTTTGWFPVIDHPTKPQSAFMVPEGQEHLLTEEEQTKLKSHEEMEAAGWFPVDVLSDNRGRSIEPNGDSENTPEEVEESKPIGAPIEGQYIVRLVDGQKAQGLIRALAVEPLEVYDAVIDGFAARLNDRQADALRRNPNVASIEQDMVVQRAGYWKTQHTQELDANGDPWGLDRIDQLSTRLTGTYRYLTDGAGVDAYVVDTGIDYAHPEFEGRARFGYDQFGGNGQDRDSHGTHVAGTIGGKKYGVAKKVGLVAVKVLDDNGSGTWSGIIAGLDWIMRNRQGPSVVCMSLGGGRSETVNTAVNKLVASGVTVVVASGNSGIDARNVSPASASGAITVGASTRRDMIPSWSNYGADVNIHAPGLYIMSATPGGRVDTYSGTSMAAPHVVGVVALLMSHNGDGEGQPADLSPDEVKDWLYETAHSGRLKGVPTGTPDRLLHKARL